MAEPLLDVRDLAVRFPTPDGVVNAVSGLSFTLSRGETLGIVGESGSGKSVTNLAILGLLNRKRADITGEVLFQGRDLLTASPAQIRDIRGKDIAMIFQDPFACLHPMYRVGSQIAEAVRAHDDVSKDAAFNRAVEVLDAVGIPNARGRARDYPHQFSGGMRQRAMIAMALVHNPDVLIADEPTTALDVTVQAQILELIDKVKRDFDIGVILITHDLGVVAETAQTVMVMYAGRAVEHGPAREVFSQPQHPYTWGLLESMPCDRGQARAAAGDRGLAAVGHRSPARLSVPSALPAPLRSLRQAAPAARPDRGRPCRRLSPRRRRQAPAVGRARGRPAGGGRVSATRDPLVEVEGLTKHFPVASGVFTAQHRRGARGRGRHAERPPRRDARHRRRVGLRQVDDRAADAQADRADRGHDPLRGPRHHEPQRARDAPGAARDADDLPGSVLVAQPAPDGGPDHRAAVLDPQDRGRPPRAWCAS